MKKTLQFFLCLMVFGLLASTSLQAQNYPDATSTSDAGISLSVDSPLSEKYEIDYSNSGWTLQTAQQAAVYLDEKSDLISIEVDHQNLRLIITLDLDAPKAIYWNLHKWNDHLSEVR